MAELANYIYILASSCWGVIAAFGALIVTLSPQHIRLARGFFLLSALPLFAVPITFGCTASSTILGLSVAALSAFVLGAVYYVGISILNAHLTNADKAS